MDKPFHTKNVIYIATILSPPMSILGKSLRTLMMSLLEYLQYVIFSNVRESPVNSNFQPKFCQSITNDHSSFNIKVLLI